ncbi:Integral membrane sensor signal transduction histidine kinase [Frankia sp. Hr75.2]|nr:Integral membrane sensor signal transduction histidine kinase [Frankia sp. Hr75.2]
MLFRGTPERLRQPAPYVGSGTSGYVRGRMTALPEVATVGAVEGTRRAEGAPRAERPSRTGVRDRATRLIAARGLWNRLEAIAGLEGFPRYPGSTLIARIPAGRARRAGTAVAGDVLPTAVVGLILLVGSTNASKDRIPPGHALDGVAYLLLALAVAVFPLRRYAPRVLLAAETLIIGSYTAIGYPHGPATLAVAAAAFTVGVRAPARVTGRAAKTCAAVLLLASLASFSRGYLDSGWDLAYTCLAVLCVAFVPALLGALLRLSRLSSARAEEEATRRRIEQERLRMAREVHDVVGHGLSIISLQAAVALHVLDRRPEQAQVALEAIRRTSVDALDELRATLALTRARDARSGAGNAREAESTVLAGNTVLCGNTALAGNTARPAHPGGDRGAERFGSRAGGTERAGRGEGAAGAGPGEALRTPLTGLSRLPGLVSEVRLCGIAVELVTDGDLAGLPAEVDLAAYRIVQESLTNVLRHAGPARARVTLRSTADHLEVEIVDEPTERSADLPADGDPLVRSTGHGLRGLRERVDELGGSLTAGPRPQGGWSVRTDLPTPAAPADPASNSASAPASNSNPNPAVSRRSGGAR